jgi:hypothetical protein
MPTQASFTARLRDVIRTSRPDDTWDLVVRKTGTIDVCHVPSNTCVSAVDLRGFRHRIVRAWVAGRVRAAGGILTEDPPPPWDATKTRRRLGLLLVVACDATATLATTHHGPPALVFALEVLVGLFAWLGIQEAVHVRALRRQGRQPHPRLRPLVCTTIHTHHAGIADPRIECLVALAGLAAGALASLAALIGYLLTGHDALGVVGLGGLIGSFLLGYPYPLDVPSYGAAAGERTFMAILLGANCAAAYVFGVFGVLWTAGILRMVDRTPSLDHFAGRSHLRRRHMSIMLLCLLGIAAWISFEAPVDLTNPLHPAVALRWVLR